MMKQISIVLVGLWLGCSNLMAQGDEDALRLSTFEHGVTSHTAGTGGAMGALGGDLGAISINPGGLGIYRHTSISITPNFRSSSSGTQFYGNTLNDKTQYNFNLNSLGIVFAGKGIKKKTGWTGLKFALAYERLADYNSSSFAAGRNANNSLLDSYLEEMNANGGINPSEVFASDPFGYGLAYETYLVNPDPSDSTQYSSVIPNGGMEQQSSIDRSGALDQFSISLAGNYSNKIFLGASLGLPYVNFSETNSFTELDIDDTLADFIDYTLTDYLDISGTGVNFKIGTVVQPIPGLRVGAAFHSPTWFALHDDYSSSMIANFDTLGQQEYFSPYGNFSYNLVTPWSVTANLGVYRKGMGFIALDYEFKDQSKSYFDFGGFASAGDQQVENQENQNIANKYGATHNIRIGGEYTYQIFRFRAGYGLKTSPFADGVLGNASGDQSLRTLSAGIGISEKNYFLDFAFQNKNGSEFYNPYSLESDATGGVEIDHKVNNFMMTLGFRL